MVCLAIASRLIKRPAWRRHCHKPIRRMGQADAVGRREHQLDRFDPSRRKEAMLAVLQAVKAARAADDEKGATLQ